MSSALAVSAPGTRGSEIRTWTLDIAKRELEEFAAQLGYRPGKSDFVAHDRLKLYFALKTHGDRRALLDALAYPARPKTPSRPRRWTPENIEAELAAFAAEVGYRPSERDFRLRGRLDLLSAMRTAGGAQRWLDTVDMPQRSEADKSATRTRRRRTNDDIERELRAYTAAMKHFPSATEMERDGRGDLRHAVKVRGGVAHWASRLGLPLRPGQDRSAYELQDAVADACAYVAAHGPLVSPYFARKHGYPRLASFIQHRCASPEAFTAEHLDATAEHLDAT